MQETIGRWMRGLLLGSLALSLAAGAALAGGPNGGGNDNGNKWGNDNKKDSRWCSDGYDRVLDTYESYANDYDLNDDGWVCVKYTAANEYFFTDNMSK
jgi:hypothetical protein